MAIDLDHRRRSVIEALVAVMAADTDERSKLLGVKGDALATATSANLDVLVSPTMPAIDRYDGVLFGAIDSASLADEARTAMDRSVLIVSGLWGLVSPSDPIPLYKLKMGARLDPLGRLSTWWRPAMAEALDRIVGDRTVWNLLPKEHDAAIVDAWGGGATVAEHYTVTFLQPNSKGELTAVSHWNKFLKGALVRHLVEHPDTSPADLGRWEHPSGFRFDDERTTTTRHGRTTLFFVKNEDGDRSG